MEQSQMIAEVEAALYAITSDPNIHQFSENDIYLRVSTEHPGLGYECLRRCVAQVMKKYDDCFEEAAALAELKQLQESIKDLPRPPRLEHMEVYVADLEIHQCQRAWCWLNGGRFGDVIVELGVDGYIAAMRDEMIRDGYQEYQVENFLAAQRRYAQKLVEETLASKRRKWWDEAPASS